MLKFAELETAHNITHSATCTHITFSFFFPIQVKNIFVVTNYEGWNFIWNCIFVGLAMIEITELPEGKKCDIFVKCGS